MATINDDQSLDKKPKNSMINGIVWVTGILLVVPSLINAGVDVYKSILNIPIGGSEQKNIQLRANHFNELPYFKKKLEIEEKNSTKMLIIHVYENADVYVNYSGNEQWLPNTSLLSSNVEFSLFSAAYADTPINIKNNIKLNSEQTSVEKLIINNTNTTQPASDIIKKSYVFSAINNKHSGLSSNSSTFTKRFSPEPGYIITEVSVLPISVNNAELLPVVNVGGDGSVEVRAIVKSGPIFDQWRGWVKAEVITKQKKIDD